MKIIFLLPPSEGKNKEANHRKEKVSFNFLKPLNIATLATEKDLKCKDKRYKEAKDLNKNIEVGPFKDAISRYSGVMYNAIDYENMTETSKLFFEDNFLILSGMYGILKPKDIIGNYKLPIETRGLYKFWENKISDELNSLKPDYIVNLLPKSYFKMIQDYKIKSKIININFLTQKNGETVSLTHGIKKVKGQWIKEICEKKTINYKDFPGNIVEEEGKININIIN